MRGWWWWGCMPKPQASEPVILSCCVPSPLMQDALDKEHGRDPVTQPKTKAWSCPIMPRVSSEEEEEDGVDCRARGVWHGHGRRKKEGCVPLLLLRTIASKAVARTKEGLLRLGEEASHALVPPSRRFA